MNPVSHFDKKEAVLVIVDVQDVLMRQMDPAIGKKIVRNIQTLLGFAKEMTIPILITEQYPKGLGKTLPEIKTELKGILPIEKLSFSCCGVETFNEKLDQSARRQAILTGIETHVCVLQTADDLMQKGYAVHAVADAICSRRKLDWEIGLR